MRPWLRRVPFSGGGGGGACEELANRGFRSCRGRGGGGNFWGLMFRSPPVTYLREGGFVFAHLAPPPPCTWARERPALPAGSLLAHSCAWAAESACNTKMPRSFVSSIKGPAVTSLCSAAIFRILAMCSS